MLLVLSQSNDLTTDKVLEWFLYYNYNNVLRINEKDFINIKEIHINNYNEVDFTLFIKNKRISLSQVNFFWYRRGHLHKKIKLANFSDNETQIQLKLFLDAEWSICRDFILNRLHDKNSLGNCFKTKVNKLENLERAKKSGLKIPNSIVSENYRMINKFLSCQACITKPISEVVNVMEFNRYIDLSTKEVRIEKKPLSNGLIFPSLLQNNIDKWIELRVFVVYDQIYAMAMFSQNNKKTKSDYRNYDNEKMNRGVPFILPEKIGNKLFQFMRESGLDTGSFDFIVTNQREYIFLEVNPAGNIEMLSESCNYYVEKKIAEIILKDTEHGQFIKEDYK
ncbi:grasp-with-spasm system ATP-grasp peptide maturase [Ancylomarina longa]|uniref:Grasp-with-spasm system ATP-grasp peptide maturase n=1 Tax=Ancylomarina longa TaxID=2487017 RepID=A0A434AWQ7_9BACT|nr:grasp-with-spasm system ATP-grasp peptide maturase [Ancylomarina longa]RUT78847.1 grasp-with-spasm system ATP-grasp peptide maturase [Ancylomarina longa]